MPSAHEQDTAPQGIGHRELPVIMVKHGVIGKVVDTIDTHAIEEGLVRGRCLKEHIREEEVDEDATDEAYFDGFALNEFDGTTSVNAARGEPEQVYHKECRRRLEQVLGVVCHFYHRIIQITV